MTVKINVEMDCIHDTAGVQLIILGHALKPNSDQVRTERTINDQTNNVVYRIQLIPKIKRNGEHLERLMPYHSDKETTFDKNSQM